MTRDENIKCRTAPQPIGNYPHAKRVGSLLFLSGIGPRPAEGGKIPGTKIDSNGQIRAINIEAQCHAVFANVNTILENAGAKWDDLVDITVFLTDIEKNFDIYNRVYSEYFSVNGPCRTTVEVNRLPTPIAIELKCIAKIQK